MNDDRFRDVYRRAIGEPAPADLAGRIRASLDERPRPAAPRAAVAAAVILALAVTGGLLGPGAWRTIRAARVATTASTPAPAARPKPALSYLKCTLPVLIVSSTGPPSNVSSEVGFVDTSTGAYTRDPSAIIDGLPGGGIPGTGLKPSTVPAIGGYSSSLRRWLPLGVLAAPDGRAYAWTKWLPEGSTTTNFQSNELHVYDLAAGTDRTLWAYPGSIDVVEWDANGILVATVPPQGGQRSLWRIDPASGSVTQEPSSADPSRVVSQPGDESDGRLQYGTTTDGHGLVVFRIGSRAPGDREWVFIQTPAGRVTIYQGTQGDAAGFDPGAFYQDTTGVWFSDYKGKVVWHWDADTGLHKFALSGLPPTPAGSNPSQVVRPVGGCF